MRSKYLFPSFLLVLVAIVGCNRQSQPDGMPPLRPVVLEFTQGGSPLAEASVSVLPEDTDKRWFAGGATDAAGKLKPMTQGRYAGLAEGKYKITVIKTEIDESTVQRTEFGVSSTPVSYYLVDPKYADAAATPLVLDVDKNTKTATFELGPAIRVKNESTGP